MLTCDSCLAGIHRCRGCACSVCALIEPTHPPTRPRRTVARTDEQKDVRCVMGQHGKPGPKPMSEAEKDRIANEVLIIVRRLVEQTR